MFRVSRVDTRRGFRAWTTRVKPGGAGECWYEPCARPRILRCEPRRFTASQAVQDRVARSGTMRRDVYLRGDPWRSICDFGSGDAARCRGSGRTYADIPRRHRRIAGPRPSVGGVASSMIAGAILIGSALMATGCSGRSEFRCRRSASPAACCCSGSRSRWCSACACAVRAAPRNRRSKSTCATLPLFRWQYR